MALCCGSPCARPCSSTPYRSPGRLRPQVLEDLAEHGGLPKFVVREFEEYLRCGLLSAGCLHLVCRSCGHSQLVALSCKCRGFCPSLPRSRSLLGYNRAPAAQVVSAFAHELDRSLRDRSLTFGDVVCRGQSAVGWMACSCRCSSLSDRFRSSSVLGSSKLGPTEAVVQGRPMSSGGFLKVA